MQVADCERFCLNSFCREVKKGQLIFICSLIFDIFFKVLVFVNGEGLGNPNKHFDSIKLTFLTFEEIYNIKQ